MRRILTAALAAAILLGGAYAIIQGAAIIAGQVAEESAARLESSILRLRVAKAERRLDALADEILRLSRGSIVADEARAIVRILDERCDDALSVDLVMRLIARESSWNPRARGSAGEIGLMQVKPSTAGLPARDLADPVRNVTAGIEYLRTLYDRLGEIGLTLAAYNTGPNSRPVRYARAILGE